MSRRRRFTATAVAGVALLAVLGGTDPGRATDGNLYVQGPRPNWLVGAQTTVRQPQAGVWEIELPAVALSFAEQKWAMSWACPVAGTEIATVSWGSLRWAAPSALAEEVVSEHGMEFHLPDVHLPQSPNPGAQYAVNLPPGRCNATLRIRQAQDVAQHKRVYWIGQPQVLVRDLTAPAVTIRDIAGALVNASATNTVVNWSTSDNFGADGMGAQTVSIGGFTKWTGSPGPGDHSITAGLAGLPDGPHRVRVTVAGDGTATGVAESTIIIDRTPPAATAPTAVTTGQPGMAGFEWTSGDVNGIRSNRIEVNTAPDGSGAGQWVAVGPELAGAGAKVVEPFVDLTSVGDGVHATRIRMVDTAGNVGHSPAGEVLVDTTPPTLVLDPLPAGHFRSPTLVVQIGDNLSHRLGLGTFDVQANLSPDGTGTGPWISVRGPEVLPPGQHRLPVDLSTLTDGRHLLRITLRNGGGYGLSLVRSTDILVDVDVTSPTLSDVSFTRTGPDQTQVEWIANDARAGVRTARVDWLDGGTWRVLQDMAAGNGLGRMTIDTSTLPPGTQRVRLVVTDAAGNASTASVTGSLEIDHTPPSITGLRVSGPPWIVVWSTPSVAPGETCPTSVALSGPQTGGLWREVATSAAAPGAHSVLLPLDGFSPGTYRVRVTACDRAGNTTSLETGGVVVGSGAVASGMTGNARMTIALPGRRAVMVDGRRRFTVRLIAGQGVRLAGRMIAGGGHPVAGQVLTLQVGGRRAAIARTGRDGRFAATLRPLRSGSLVIVGADGSRLDRDQLSADVRLRVLPAVSFRASARTAVAFGAPIVFSGTVRPAPAALGLRTPKTVTLEWRDPVRGVWRPVVNQSLTRAGRFSIAWRFQAAGQRIPMRLRVPAELGWGLEPHTSRTIVMTVR